MHKLEIIPESIWEKIKADKLEARRMRRIEHPKVIEFCLENEELNYIIGVGSRTKPKNVRPKTNRAPIVRRRDETKAS